MLRYIVNKIIVHNFSIIKLADTIFYNVSNTSLIKVILQFTVNKKDSTVINLTQKIFKTIPYLITLIVDFKNIDGIEIWYGQ